MLLTPENIPKNELKNVSGISTPKMRALKLTEALGRGKTDKNFKLPTGVVDHSFDYAMYEQAYLTVPIIAGGIDKTVDFVIGPGFSVKSENKAAAKKINKWIQDNQFDSYLRTILRNQLVFGIAPVELLGEGEETRVNLLDPKSFFVKIDESGEIIGYCQVLHGKTVANWTLEEIAYFSYNNIAKDPYGTSMLRALFGSKKISLLQNFLEMEQAMNTLIKRKANAPLHVKIGSDEFPAQQGDLDSFASDLALLRNENEFVTTHTVEMDVVGFRSQILDFKPFIEHYENNIIYGLQVPVVLMGLGNVNEGLAKVQMEALNRRAKSIQASTEKEIEEVLFKKIIGESEDHVEVEWTSATEDTTDQKILRLQNVLKTPGLSDETRKDIEKEIRKMLGFKEIEITLPAPITQPGQSFGKPAGGTTATKPKKENFEGLEEKIENIGKEVSEIKQLEIKNQEKKGKVLEKMMEKLK